MQQKMTDYTIGVSPPTINFQMSHRRLSAVIITISYSMEHHITPLRNFMVLSTVTGPHAPRHGNHLQEPAYVYQEDVLAIAHNYSLQSLNHQLKVNLWLNAQQDK